MGHANASRFITALRISKLVLAVSAGLLSWSCFNQSLEPVAPSWDSNLSLPLLHRSYTLSDLIRKDTSLLHVGAGGQIVYATSTQVTPTYIGDLITVALRDTTVRVKFGSFSVNMPPLDVPIQFPWLPQGVNIPIPDTTINVAVLQDTIGTFQRVRFKSGNISLTLRNNLPVFMVVTNPIRLVESHGSQVASFVFPDTIYPNSSRTATDDLAGDSLDHIVSITGISLHTAGSRVPVAIPSGTLFSAHLATSNLKANQAVFANIPPQRLSDNDTTQVTIDDSTLVREMHIRAGSLHLAFASHEDLDITLKYRLTQLLRWDGGAFVPYEDSIALAPNTSGSRVVSLANTKIASQGQELLRSLQVISSVVLPYGSIQPVTVNDTDRITINITRPPDSAIVADSAVGVLKPTWVGLNTIVPVRFGDLPSRFNGQLNIPSATLALWTNSTIGFPMDLNIRIGARRSTTSDSIFITVPASQKRVESGPDLVLFDAAEVGRFLSQFSSGFPRELRIEGRALVNPPDAYDPSPAGMGAVGSHSSLGGRADMEIPLVMGIVSGDYRDTLALGDTTADGHKDYTIDKKQINNVSSGSVTIEVKNAMPVQVGVAFRLLDIAKQSLLRVPQSGSELGVNAAGVDANGNVTVPASSVVSFQLTQDEVRQFNPAEYLTVTVSLITTPGSPTVRFKTTDSVEVRSWSSLRYRINP